MPLISVYTFHYLFFRNLTIWSTNPFFRGSNEDNASKQNGGLQ